MSAAASSSSRPGAKPLDLPGAFKSFLVMPSITRARFLTPTQPTRAEAVEKATSSASASSSSASSSPSADAPLAPIWVCTNVKNVTHDEARTWQQTFVPDASARGNNAGASGALAYKPFGVPTPLETLATVHSPSRRLVATFRNAPAKDGAASKVPSYLIEVTDCDPNSATCGRVLQSVNTAGVHGRVFLTGNFGGFAWSRNESSLVYMAEPKADERKSASWFPSAEEEEKQRAAPGGNGAAPPKGTQFELQEDWGEQLVGVRNPRPWIMRWNGEEPDSAKLYGVRGIPDNVSAGQVIFSGWNESQYRKGAASGSDAPLFDEGLYLTIYPHEQENGGRRLGMIYYNTRESKICYLPARCIVDPVREAETKRAKERARKVKKDAADRARREQGLPERTEEEEAAEAEADRARKNAETKRERRLNRLIVLTPSDHSAQSPRLDGYSPLPQLVYLTTARVWHHCSGMALKTFIVLPATLGRFLAVVDTPYPEDAEEEELKSPVSPASGNGNGDDEKPQESRVFEGNTHEMVPLVDKPASIHSFPGLYPPTNMLPGSHSFAFDSKHILMLSSWRSQYALLLCCDEDDSLSRLPLPVDAPANASLMLHDVDRRTGRLLIGASSLTTPEALYVGQLQILRPGQDVEIGRDFLPVVLVHKDGSAYGEQEDGGVDGEGEEDGDDSVVSGHVYAQIRYTRVTAPAQPLHPEAAQRMERLRMEVLQVPVPEEEKYPDGSAQLPFEAVLLTSVPEGGLKDSSAPLPPLLAFPHGGPHGNSPTSFVPHVAFMCAAAGFSVLYINYRGSPGFGQAMLESLPGKCGDQDVRDCRAAVELVLSRTGKAQIADRNNVHVQGGSHGGFLTTHLIGQYPDLFRSAVARNPVCNIAAMFSSSDIVDWCFFEATGEPYDPKVPPTVEQYSRMFNASPIKHVGAVQTPLLMLLGAADRRVPMAQAHDYLKLLKGRGVRARALLYESGKHPLAESVGMEGDVWLSMVTWALQRKDAGDVSLPPMVV